MRPQKPAGIQTAMIIAAGAGKRMSTSTAHRPKMFLEVHGRRLIDYQFAHLKARGISHVIMATGHMHELVVDTLGRQHMGIRIRYAENSAYASTGSACSLLGCRSIWQEAPQDVLFLHSDILYDPAILDLVLSSKHAIVLALDDTYETITNDEVVMTGQAGAVQAVHQGRIPATHGFVGEIVGINRWSKEFLADLFEYLDLTLSRSDKADHYEFLTVGLARKRKHRMNYVSTNGLSWININYEEDLQYARDTVYPAITTG